MAVVEEGRALEGLDVSVHEVGCSVSDAHISPTLVAKAAAMFDLPNLLHHASSDFQSSERNQERSDLNSAVIWKTESCCSCTPQACMTGSGRDTEEEIARSPSTSILLYPAEDITRHDKPAENGNKTVSTFTSLSCTDTVGLSDTPILTIRRHPTVGKSADNKEKDGQEEDIEGDGGALHSQSLCGGSVLLENNRTQFSHEKKMESPQQQNSKTTYRRRVADYEREWTFRPKLNHASIRLASQAARSQLPVSHRLYENRRLNERRLHENFTFCPKLNAASLRLAQERAEKLPEVSIYMYM